MGALTITAVLLLSSSDGAAADVTVTKLDGQQIVGRIVGWSDGRVRLATSDGEHEFQHAELLSVRRAEQPPARSESVSLVELIDGSTLPVASFTAVDKDANLLLGEWVAPASREVRLPVESVAAVELVPMRDDAASQWENIRQQ
jgi:hypothetical protein